MFTIILKEEFKEKIINRHQKDGIKWLESINSVIDKYTNIFHLRDIKLLDYLSMNIILTANAQDYGDIIIKIGAPGMTFINEIKYINFMPIDNMVKCYYYNIEDRIMILEKITPGYTLFNEKSFNKRLKIFSMLLNNVCKETMFLNKFPSYEDKLKRKLIVAKSLDNVDPNILDMLILSNDMYKEIASMNLPKYVLHKDLKHKNILKSETGWKMIDPHGVVGEKVFDTCQFIKAELPNNSVKSIKKIAKKVAKSINEDVDLIYKALYIDTTTKILFYIKSKDDKDTISYNINLCKNILNCIKK